MNNEVIKLTDVSFSNIDYLVLDNINVSIYLHSFTAIIGKSGAGKSTLLKLMSGILTPTKGKVEIYGRDIHNLETKEILSIKKKLGFAFQDSALLSNLTIRENLSLPLRFHFKNITEEYMNKKITEYLEKVNLMDSIDLRPAQLSLGEQKMVSLIRALIIDPEILFIDEALSNIDPSLRKVIINLIKEYAEKPWTTVVGVTHNKKILETLATRILVVDEKRIKIDITKEELLENKNFYNCSILQDIFD
ncbi:MAG TPA: ATP-binding cassette domain-containing protein [Spirochaetota bacterium]|nr:ATP-binding cassette domain-containing protein [Spirochaetota bacterium]HOL56833.1 ATP-binding cassette domain-containing protein [Spirochaetota bacterium]HPP04271.1 ATP-binding cassette domain-containing protein [Spirochaetota bacterium]